MQFLKKNKEPESHETGAKCCCNNSLFFLQTLSAATWLLGLNSLTLNLWLVVVQARCQNIGQILRIHLAPSTQRMAELWAFNLPVCVVSGTLTPSQLCHQGSAVRHDPGSLANGLIHGTFHPASTHVKIDGHHTWGITNRFHAWKFPTWSFPRMLISETFLSLNLFPSCTHGKFNVLGCFIQTHCPYIWRNFLHVPQPLQFRKHCTWWW